MCEESCGCRQYICSIFISMRFNTFSIAVRSLSPSIFTVLNYLNMVFGVCISKQENIFVEHTSNVLSVFRQRRIIQLLTDNKVWSCRSVLRRSPSVIALDNTRPISESLLRLTISKIVYLELGYNLWCLRGHYKDKMLCGFECGNELGKDMDYRQGTDLCRYCLYTIQMKCNCFDVCRLFDRRK